MIFSLRNSIFLGCIFFISCAGYKEVPNFDISTLSIPPRTEISENYYEVGASKLQKNEFGIWEMYVEGNPLERGLTIGKLSEELIYKQEKTFVSKIEELVPSKFQQKLVLGFLNYFNRKLDDYVTEEYEAEIYGISQFSSEEFDFVAPSYWRTLYFHGAHDIGHALQDLAMVGCTSFAAWGNHTEDGKMILGRNFDFYINEEFAENKIVTFIQPEKGYNHTIVTWPGFVGAVSGMNEKGLTVTINAGKSSIPFTAKTPISLVTREILQYASNIDEAIEIAQKREVFVSEAIMVGSAEDKTAVLIEVSPKKFGVFKVESSSDLLVCSNHFQSEIYQSDKKNKQTIAESHSQYRWDRMNELIEENPKITPQIAADFLRNKDGLNDMKIGYGNEKALNQLLAHHAVIFQPEDRLMWVSANPFQLGAFVAYDLDEVFESMKNSKQNEIVFEEELTIPEDDFVQSKELTHYFEFKSKLKEIQMKTIEKEEISDKELNAFIELNPEFWLGYFTVGEFYFAHKNYAKALEKYQIALTKEITTLPDKERIQKRIQQSERKIK